MVKIAFISFVNFDALKALTEVVRKSSIFKLNKINARGLLAVKALKTGKLLKL